MKHCTCKSTNVSNRSALWKVDFQFQPDSTQTVRKPFPDSILVMRESERVNGGVSPSQHTLITFFKCPHPHPGGTHTKGALEDNENSGPAVGAHMGWCWEQTDNPHKVLIKWESACKSVFTWTRVLTSLPTTSRSGSRATTDATLWLQPWSHSSLISKQHFRLFTCLIQQLPAQASSDNVGARQCLMLMAGAQVAVSLCDSEVCFVCALIIHIVPANSWRLPWRDKRSLLPAPSLWCHADENFHWE